MSYFTGANILPKFNIKKIIFSQDNVRILCALSRPPAVTHENWLGSNEFLSYMKYYFLIVPDLQSMAPSLLSKIYYANTRIESFSEAVFGEDSANMPHIDFPTAIGRSVSLGGILSSAKSVKTLYLDEILQGQYFAKDPLVATETVEPMEDSALDIGDKYSTYFEVTIDYPKNEDLQLEKQDLQDTVLSHRQINILAFSHLDIQKLDEELDLHSYSRSLYDIGTDAIYEPGLIGTNRGTHKSWKKHINRDVFFTPDGSIWSGLVHYHGPDNMDQPGNYVGYMTGLSHTPESMRLTVRSIRNYKVVYNFQRDNSYHARDSGGFRDYYGAGSGYFEEYEAPKSGFSALDPFSWSATGESLLQALNSTMGRLKSLEGETSPFYQDKLRVMSIRAKQTDNVGIMDYSLPPDSLSFLNIMDGQGQRSHYGSVFRFNLGNALIHNSRFGHLYDNIVENLDKLRNSGAMEPLMMPMYYSKVNHMAIFRRRITNLPTINNASSTAKYEAHDINEEQKLIVTTTGPQGDQFIVFSENQKGKIEEPHPSSEVLVKNLYMTDYDLFENYHYGKF